MPEEPDFERFGHADAWRLGRALVEQCQAENLPVTITITLGEQRVFHAALPGTSADNDDWAMRKIRVVRRFDRSSHEVGETYAAAGPERFYAAFGLPATDYAATGGAVPIRVRGTQVGVLAISGLSSFDDHERARQTLQVAASPSATEDLQPLSRSLQPGQRTQIWLGGPDLDAPQLIFGTDAILLEAPNWTFDGTTLVVNGNGLLFTLDLADPSGGPREIPYVDLPTLNNDHVLDPDGEHVYLSAMDTHIYRGALTGGAVERVSPEDNSWHFLHGISPDGQRLAYVQLDGPGEPGRLAIRHPDGSVSLVDVGPGHLDGPEWSPDGQWIYLNTETFTHVAGHAQLARVRDADGRVERLVVSDTGGLVPAPVPRRGPCHLSRLSGRHPGPSRRPRRGGTRRVDERLVDSTAALPALRRSGDAERQQLVARLDPVRLRRLPGRLRGALRPHGLRPVEA
ncbi:heme-binding protein [uncultured Friedmanniella sp.]|uniref:heme-binding protein n=1 Tax=uncultured Friedmanniella sp. TaxID=335381 RepID=UPI0035CB0ADB